MVEQQTRVIAWGGKKTPIQNKSITHPVYTKQGIMKRKQCFSHKDILQSAYLSVLDNTVITR